MSSPTQIKSDSTLQEVQTFLEDYGQRTLLRFTTVGSVDDGKSTLIGRLLHDSKSIFEDQIATLKGESKQNLSDEQIDFSLLTDGLKAEREQGITIDVAYRYFSTPKRNFIIADTPGHEQYTRNMATGASTANLAIILIDARHGVIEQTQRHSFIASLLGIPRLLICVNKMDLVNYSEDVFDNIREQYTNFATKLGIVDLKFIPISALKGDNVVEQSENMTWYHGEPVMEYLEDVYIGSDRNLVDFRFPVQSVIRPDHTFRGFAGQLASGRIRVGEEVMVLPSMRRSKIKEIHQFDKTIEQAFASQSVTITLEDEVDISRGDMLVRPRNVPHSENHFESMIVWMSEVPMDPSKTYVIKQTSRQTKANVLDVRYQVDVNSLSRNKVDHLNLNEIGRVAFRTNLPLFFDPYKLNRMTGSFIMIDPLSNNTVAAGMIIDRVPTERLREESDVALKNRNIHRHEGSVTQVEREAKLNQKGVTLWFTGLSGSGKSTIAGALERRLFDLDKNVYRLDGDNVRAGLCGDLGFSRYDRKENIRRVAEVASLFNSQGTIILASLISPYQEERDSAKEIVGEERFVEVYVKAPLETCEQRDPKGLYKKARAGEIQNFTGVSDAYEEPTDARIVLDTEKLSVDECVDQLLDLIDELS